MLENKINTMGTKPSKSGHSTLLQIRADKIVPYKKYKQVRKFVRYKNDYRMGSEITSKLKSPKSYNMVEIMHINH